VTTHVHLTPLNGFAGPVTLTAPGLPWGTTATFSPATVSAGNPTATLTLTTSSDGPVGDLPVTITPTGPPGTVVTGNLFIDDFSNDTGGGDELATIPYTYTVG